MYIYIYIYRVDVYLGIRGTSDRCSTKMCASTQPFFSPVFLFGTRRKQVSPSAVVVISGIYDRILYTAEQTSSAHTSTVYATYSYYIRKVYYIFLYLPIPISLTHVAVTGRYVSMLYRGGYITMCVCVCVFLGNCNSNDNIVPTLLSTAPISTTTL